jgi:ankyrin repeat protein
MLVDLHEILRLGDSESIIKWSRLFSSIQELYQRYLHDFTFPLHISKHGDTLLHVACRYGHMDIIKLLLKWSSYGSYDSEKLDRASISMLEFILEENAQHDLATDIAYNTEIIILLDELKFRLKWLIKYICDGQSKHRELVQAVIHSDTKKSMKILRKNPPTVSELLDIRDSDQGFHFYHWLCTLNLEQILKYCMTSLSPGKQGSGSIWKQFPHSNSQDFSILHEAIRFSCQEAALYLITEQQMNPTEKNTKNVSPIDLASKSMRRILKASTNLELSNHYIVKQPLVSVKKKSKEEKERSPKVHSPDHRMNDKEYESNMKKKRGRPPKSKADIQDYSESSRDQASQYKEKSLSNGSKVMKEERSHSSIETKLNPTTKEKSTGRTQLHRFSSKGDLVSVKALISMQVNVNIQDNAGYTALHAAALNGHTDIVELLLNSGANPNMQSYVDGDTPLHDAYANQHNDVVKLLILHGADPQVKNQKHEPAIPINFAKDIKNGPNENLNVNGKDPNILDGSPEESRPPKLAHKMKLRIDNIYPSK